MNNKSGKAALILATLALVASLAGFAPAAGFLITSSKQIKPGVVLSSDIHKNGVRASDIDTGAVRSSDLQNGTVSTADIGEGQVTPETVTAPEPIQCTPSGGSAEVGTTPAKVLSACTYTKQDPTSLLEVEWTGTAQAGFSPCVFQIRINGQAAGAGAGEVYVANGSTLAVSASALFADLPPGPVEVEVWARATIETNVSFPCTVGPAETVPQTFVVGEKVV